jgi:hypothetical protein
VASSLCRLSTSLRQVGAQFLYEIFPDNRRAIYRTLKRLHKANFVRGSMNERNIFVQPDPLNLPLADRLLDKPSYRIVDFGRGL